MLPINYLHERKTMIKSKKNTIGIVKDTICKIALKKANTNCLSLMYDPPKTKVHLVSTSRSTLFTFK